MSDAIAGKSLHRRALVTGGTALALFAAIPGAKAQTPVIGEWSFTDDKGNTIALPEAPTRIIADLIAAAALWDFGVRPIGVFGWDVNPDGTFNIAGGRVDPEAVEIVGNATTPFDAEPAIGARPDLIVTLTDGSDDPDLYWSIDPKIVGVAREIAPILAINTSVQLDQVVARFAELATALGADLASDEIRASKANADQAALDFAAGVDAKPELSAMFISTTEEALYIANPKVTSDLIYFRDLGLDIPDLDVADTDYWEALDWEQSLKYPVDVVFYSTRVGLTADELTAHPVFSRHPAVIAGQLYPWNGEEPLSYQGITTTLTNTLASIEAAIPVEA